MRSDQGKTAQNFLYFLRLRKARLHLSLACQIERFKGTKIEKQMPSKLMGLNIQSPVGIAAGIDKTGRLAGLVEPLGFGFLEIGSVTPGSIFKLQKNLLKPRNLHRSGVIGVNMSCEQGAPVNNAIEQYINVFENCLPLADYFVLNLSPSNPIISPDREIKWISRLLTECRKIRNSYLKKSDEESPVGHKPIALKVKVAANRIHLALKKIELVKKIKLDGAIVVTPQSMSEKQNHVLLGKAKALLGNADLISVGGIRTSDQMRNRLDSGAQAIQIATGLIDHGPYLARHILSSHNKISHHNETACRIII